MRRYITEKWLTEKGACSPSLAVFKRVFPKKKFPAGARLTLKNLKRFIKITDGKQENTPQLIRTFLRYLIGDRVGFIFYVLGPVDEIWIEEVWSIIKKNNKGNRP